MSYYLLNGDIISRDAVTLDPEDRGYQFGDGIYEVVRVYNGRLFTNSMHLDRLFLSAEKIAIELPFTKQELTAQLQKLIEVNQLSTGTIYLQVTRGVAPRKHHYPESATPVYVAYTNVVERDVASMTNGVKTVLVDDIRWLRCDIKSLNLLGNAMAKQQAVSEGAAEAIQHRDGTVTEGASSNVFIVKDGVLKTHPAVNLILNGITRQVILDLCKENQLPLEEVAFSVDELLQADEVFITSTGVEITPVTKIDSHLVNNGEVGTITKQLQALFTNVINAECGTVLV